MSAEYLLMAGVFAGFMGFAYWQGYSNAQSKQEAKAPYGIEVQILEAVDSVPEGSMMIISYPGFLTGEQREMIKLGAEAKVGDRMKVMIFEGGLKANVVTNPVPMPSSAKNWS